MNLVITITMVCYLITGDICREKQSRCESRCAENHQVGSVNHLKCNDRCREKYLFCIREPR